MELLYEDRHLWVAVKPPHLLSEQTPDKKGFADLLAAENNGYIRAMWCGDLACEMKLKECADVTSRCMPFHAEPIGDRCVCCGREAKKLVYWGKAY